MQHTGLDKEKRDLQNLETPISTLTGRDEDNHRQGVGVLMPKSAGRALMQSGTLSAKEYIQARYYSKSVHKAYSHS